jgi:hypothetical protein
MKRHDFLHICRAAASTFVLILAGLPTTASAAEFLPIELVAEDDAIAIGDPYCPTCYDDPPSELVADTDTKATLVLACDRTAGETLHGTLVIEVELHDGKLVRIHREPMFELCMGEMEAEYETTLYAGPDWTWSEAVRAKVTVIEG